MNTPEHNSLNVPGPDTEDVHTIQLTPAEKDALREMIDDRMWWDEAVRRARRFGVIIAAGATVVAFLAVWWPWITSVAQALLKNAPTP